MVSKVVMCFVAIGIALMTAGFSLVHAQEPPPPLPTPTPLSPADCQSCHLDVAVTWQFSTHALAYSNETFQTAWFSQRSDPTCLACHTTGFTARTQTYKQEGVACVACHGDTPIDHPPEQVKVIGGEVCADCHTTTYSEWERGAHSLAGIGCNDCHDPHQATLLAGDSQSLCLSCHETVEQTYSHITHTEQLCVDCHYHARPISTDHFVSGNLRPTGHQVDVFTIACIDCHEAKFLENAPQPIADSHTTSTLTARQAPDDTLSLIQGVLLGGGFGVTMTAFFIQMRRRRAH